MQSHRPASKLGSEVQAIRGNTPAGRHGMISKDQRRLRIGVLGCGPIAQAVHLDACRKAHNAELHAICDVADALRERMGAVHQPSRAYSTFPEMLEDADVDAVLIAVADGFHVAAAIQSLKAGKHVLVEKPLGTTVEECESLVDLAARSGLVVQVGNNRRFDPGLRFARQFVREELGPRISLRTWYHDSAYRYTMTDNLQPPPTHSPDALRPEAEPRANPRRYFLLAHGSHLVDTAQLLGGPISGVRARRLERSGSFCWFVDVDFADGSLGHLDLHVPVRGDFEEGFVIQGEHGSVSGRLHHPWFHKAGEVECFSARDRQYRRVLGEDAHTYKLQIEGFASCVLDGVPQLGASPADGLAAVRALVAIARSVESGDHVRLDQVSGGV
ncbi:MAG: Gfo/Idh/MocA family oxidoreductase [Isosphaeraceae bacterium]